MQIDFHHAVTYVCARQAGFSHEEADIVAYAAQYVDDATSSGVVRFDNKALYCRISSAHKMLDKHNLSDVDNHRVWLPFHFLPGNDMLPAGQNPDKNFIHKIVCRPNSPVAKDIVAAAIADRDKPYALHRLGITMHIYADTWAHQGFAGVLNKINEVDNAKETGDTDVFGGLSGFLTKVLDDIVPPLGHGRANIFPDMPFLNWQYHDGHDTIVVRENTNAFCEAADCLCKVMQRFRGVPETGIKAAELTKIRELFTSFLDKEGEDRHQKWLNAIRDNYFAFDLQADQQLEYSARGRMSWKYKALSSSHDLPVHSWEDAFLNSNWKFFHDALQAYRSSVLHDILPQYGICAA